MVAVPGRGDGDEPSGSFGDGASGELGDAVLGDDEVDVGSGGRHQTRVQAGNDRGFAAEVGPQGDDRPRSGQGRGAAEVGLPSDRAEVDAAAYLRTDLAEKVDLEG